MKTIQKHSLATLALISVYGSAAAQYLVTPLVSDNSSVSAPTHDPNLVDAWGITDTPSGPWWVSDNGTNLATLYSGTGAVESLVVKTPSNPDGQVFNGGGGFDVSENVNGTLKTGSSLFIVSTELGEIAGWSPGVDASQFLPLINNTGVASYKGLGISGGDLFAANFAQGSVDIYDSSLQDVGSLVDPSVPTGYDPFNAQVFGSTVYVTYALNDGTNNDVAGLGNGFVDRFSTSGQFLGRLVSNGLLDSPWGLAIAPGNFGTFSNDLLVGNFGNGEINAYNPITGAYEGTLGNHGKPLQVDGLWGIGFGNGAAAGPSNVLYFGAGPHGENDGQFGSIKSVPAPGALLPFALGAIGTLHRRRAMRV